MSLSKFCIGTEWVPCGPSPKREVELHSISALQFVFIGCRKRLRYEHFQQFSRKEKQERLHTGSDVLKADRVMSWLKAELSFWFGGRLYAGSIVPTQSIRQRLTSLTSPVSHHSTASLLYNGKKAIDLLPNMKKPSWITQSSAWFKLNHLGKQFGTYPPVALVLLPWASSGYFSLYFLKELISDHFPLQRDLEFTLELDFKGQLCEAAISHDYKMR